VPVTIRRVGDDDLSFLADMLLEAGWAPDNVNRPTREQLPDHTLFALFLGGWGRKGDGGFIAVDDAGTRLGAAWYRLFNASLDPAYGVVDESTPVLSIAVAEPHRRHGVGRMLLRALCEEARRGRFDALSLSVSARNSGAIALYEEIGFALHKDLVQARIMRIDLTQAIPR